MKSYIGLYLSVGHKSDAPNHYLCVSVSIALLQTAALAVFGAHTATDPYNAITNPSQYSQYFGQALDPANNPILAPYLGWCYWMGVVGDMLSVLSGVLFLLAAWCNCCDKDEMY